jgi:hypothetical protein
LVFGGGIFDWPREASDPAPKLKWTQSYTPRDTGARL